MTWPEPSSDEVHRLSQLAESRTLEFKEVGPDFDSAKGRAEFAKDVLAIANSVDIGEHAHILYGVRDPRRGAGIVGITSPPTPEQVSQVIADHTVPPPQAMFRVVSTPSGQVGVLRCVGVAARPHHAVRAFEGALNPSIVYVRRDSVNSAATSQEVEQMILQRLGSTGRTLALAPLSIGFVGQDRYSGDRNVIIRVTNTTESSVAGIDVIVDFVHMSLPTLSARQGVLNNLTLLPGESREEVIHFSNLQFVLRAMETTSKPRIYRVLVNDLGSHVGDRWFNATLRVFYRGADGFLHQLTSDLALDF